MCEARRCTESLACCLPHSCSCQSSKAHTSRTSSRLPSRCPSSLHTDRPRSHRLLDEANNVAQRGVAARLDVAHGGLCGGAVRRQGWAEAGSKGEQWEARRARPQPLTLSHAARVLPSTQYPQVPACMPPCPPPRPRTSCSTLMNSESKAFSPYQGPPVSSLAGSNSYSM